MKETTDEDTNLEWFTLNHKKRKPKPYIETEVCRICDGPCKGKETHDKTRKSWLTQSPTTVKGYERHQRTSRNI